MNTNKIIGTYDIVRGPSRDTLFDACKYAYDKGAKINVEFVAAYGYTMPKNDPTSAYVAIIARDIVVCGIEHEDGSGESFNIHGYCKISLKSSTDPEAQESKFRAYYNAKRRGGIIVFFD